MLLFAAAAVYAQGSTAHQQVILQLAPAIDIASGGTLNVGASGSYFHIKANKEFNISVSVENGGNDLLLAIGNNETGGAASSGYTAYAPVQASSQNLLTNCTHGNDRSFAVNYKTGKSRDAVLVYTATQP